MNEAEVTSEELRELIRAGHAMIKDLTAAQKATRVVMNEARAVIQEAKDADRTEAVRVMQEVADAAERQIVDEVAKSTDEACEFVQETIYKRFDLLMDVLLGKDNGRRLTGIGDVVADALDPKIDLDAVRATASPIERPPYPTHEQGNPHVNAPFEAP